MLTALQFETFDGEYVQRLTDGDSDAGNHFASYFSSVLSLKLRVRLRIPESVDDVLQATLLRVIQILREGAGIRSPEKFGAFVNSVCENVIREHFRAERRYESREGELPDPIDPSVDLDEDLVNADTRRQIDEILNTLSEKDQRILRAIYLDETEKAELCERFHIEQGYLRVLQHRAKAHFREAYERLNDQRPLKPPPKSR